MSNRWLRFGVALLALTAVSAAGYRFVDQDSQLVADARAARVTDQAAISAVTTVEEVKAALHAYVAPGQSIGVWAPRAARLIDALRASMLELDSAVAPAGASMKDALDASDRLAAAELRAREYVDAGQSLLAGDVVFTESRDLLDAIRGELTRARDQAAELANARQAAIRREQMLLALAAAAILVLAVLILLPAARTAERVEVVPPTATDTPAEEEEYARLIPTAPADQPEASQEPTDTIGVPNRGVLAPAGGPVVVPLEDAASVCTGLATASDSREITTLLARASAVLNASGLIVWMASPDRRELYAAVGTGYDERLLSRLGAIAREDVNLTAAAFRSGHARTAPATGQSAAALAVPLVTPSGAVGVLSAELRRVDSVDPQQLAVATIFAAQLSMLLGSMVADSLPTAQQA